ncbi:hypothetical protein TELCIR_22124, partial [Teladorsagia circumcincta]
MSDRWQEMCGRGPDIATLPIVLVGSKCEDMGRYPDSQDIVRNVDSEYHFWRNWSSRVKHAKTFLNAKRAALTKDPLSKTSRGDPDPLLIRPKARAWTFFTNHVMLALICAQSEPRFGNSSQLVMTFEQQ